MEKKVLLIGGTGAMGTYLTPELLRKGYRVDVISVDHVSSDNPMLRYFTGDAMDDQYLKEILKNQYDGIVDFMIYKTERFKERHPLLLQNTDHYIYLSSYRVYCGQTPITESTPRMLDVSDNPIYLATDDYSLLKARGENILKASPYKNWTAVRPSCVYSKRRFQLCTLEANVIIPRARQHKPVILPQEARSVQATMTWSGDIARMFSGLLFNPQAMCESYTFSTSEHHTWETVASYYHDIIGLDTIWVPRESYLKLVVGSDRPNTGAHWQLDYDRLFNRVIDNRKILEHAGLHQEDFMPLKEGLQRELSNLPEKVTWPGDNNVGERMDQYLKENF